jgi:hypothetical protein
MPIEIKELVIRAVVSGNDQPSQARTSSQEELEKLKAEITNEVIGKVFRALQQKNER